MSTRGEGAVQSTAESPISIALKQSGYDGRAGYFSGYRTVFPPYFGCRDQQRTWVLRAKFRGRSPVDIQNEF